ncbi:MAG: hypothetical protein M0P71_16225 [Melioribacteraceae bacterium]|jgi:hypothetical protein|nr:hypothetical protein [Melioribacteraceae bacterium]
MKQALNALPEYRTPYDIALNGGYTSDNGTPYNGGVITAEPGTLFDPGAITTGFEGTGGPSMGGGIYTGTSIPLISNGKGGYDYQAGEAARDKQLGLVLSQSAEPLNVGGNTVGSTQGFVMDMKSLLDLIGMTKQSQIPTGGNVSTTVMPSGATQAGTTTQAAISPTIIYIGIAIIVLFFLMRK